MTYDILIRNGKVVDGTGNPWFYGDVALAGDRIAAVAPRGRIDAGECAPRSSTRPGMVVCPGFIDIQSHSIMPLMLDGRCLSKITQGVTTEIMGEAWTPAPFGGRIADPMPRSLIAERCDEWDEQARELDALRRTGSRRWSTRGVSPNVGSFLGGGDAARVRARLEMGAADADELATMRRVMDEAMEMARSASPTR